MILLKIGKVLERINKYICWIAMAAIAAMMILITVDVLLRLLFNSPILGSYEICQFLLVISLYGSFAYIQSAKGHVSVNLLVDKFPAAIRTILLGIGYLFSTFFAFVWGYEALYQGFIYSGSGNETALLKISYVPFYYFEGICMIAFGIVLLLDTITLFASLGNKDLAKEVATWEGGSND